MAGYWAWTRTDDLSGEDTSHRAHVDYVGDRYGVQLERLVVGDHFNPEVGLLRRDDMRKKRRSIPVQPAASVDHVSSQILVDRLGGLHRERRRPAGNA